MTWLFRSKSNGLTEFNPTNKIEDDDEEEGEDNDEMANSSHQSAIIDILVTALRKSLVTCSIETEDVNSMDIGWPTDVRHVSHVTFDRFNGFLGLPVELEPEVTNKAPSASASVFGVSAKSMQCSYDERMNSVPTILLLMQKQLYAQGGLKAEGIFRVNAENSQEEHVRAQLNQGFVPHGIDVHCLAGLIKAWLRELPTGVLDSLTPEQVMQCSTERDCTHLVKLLPPTEAALLDWAINLMADVAQLESLNKMNARNIAMVFAPNMTQMADPLTALIHAVQVMNFLKTLILKIIREREESATDDKVFSSCSNSPDNTQLSCEKTRVPPIRNFSRTITYESAEPKREDKVWSVQKRTEVTDKFKHFSQCNSSPVSELGDLNNRHGGAYENADADRLNWRKGVRRLCRLQLSKPARKALGIVNSRGRGGETWLIRHQP